MTDLTHFAGERSEMLRGATGGGNGRVNLGETGDAGKPVAPFALFSLDNPNHRAPTASSSASSTSSTAADGQKTMRQLADTEVSQLFFSARNMEALQQGLRYRVFVETAGRHTIGRQSETELLTVMRSIYLQYSANKPFNVRQQVVELNARVLDYCVRTVVSEADARGKYLYDISHLPEPLARAPMATTKGSKQLINKPFLGEDMNFNTRGLA